MDKVDPEAEDKILVRDAPSIKSSRICAVSSETVVSDMGDFDLVLIEVSDVELLSAGTWTILIMTWNRFRPCGSWITLIFSTQVTNVTFRTFGLINISVDHHSEGAITYTWFFPVTFEL